jgi:hypothetical protein
VLIMNARSNRATFLRRSLLLDAAASGGTGALLLLGAEPLSTLIGLTAPVVARIVGAGLLVYGAALLWHGRCPEPSRAAAIAAVVLNVAWVVVSALVIEVGLLTTIGDAAVAAVAAAVLLFAMLQIVGLKRLSA